jgi:uncharacterized FlaG/YvyC family protein
MHVSKIEPATPSMTVIPAVFSLGKAEARGRGVSGSHLSTERLEAGEQQVSGPTLGGTKQTLPVERTRRERDVEETLQRLNGAFKAFGDASLRLSYDYERQMVIMQVVRAGEQGGDKEEVIRQIPPEDLLQLVDRLEELQGVLFDRQV